MATQAKIGYGSLLKKGDGNSPEQFHTIEEVTNIGAFGASREILEATNLDSPNAFKEYVAGMKDGIELSVEVNFRPNASQQSRIYTDFNTGTIGSYQLLLTGGIESYNFTALCLGWETNIEPNAVITATFRLKISGDIIT